ncbi:MAG: RNA polymerase sigma factor [Eubacterium sp.]
MKKICEIYDISQEYEMKEKSVLICVSDLDKDKLFEILPELKNNFNEIFNDCKWQEYLEINKAYNRNESKHYMREIRQSKRVESDALMRYETDTISEILNNTELKTKIEMALSTLLPLPKRRFLKHYLEHLTYREIAKEEGKAVSTIYESIMTARKKFLKNFE